MSKSDILMVVCVAIIVACQFILGFYIREDREKIAAQEIEIKELKEYRDNTLETFKFFKEVMVEYNAKKEAQENGNKNTQ